MLWGWDVVDTDVGCEDDWDVEVMLTEVGVEVVLEVVIKLVVDRELEVGDNEIEVEVAVVWVVDGGEEVEVWVFVVEASLSVLEGVKSLRRAVDDDGVGDVNDEKDETEDALLLLDILDDDCADEEADEGVEEFERELDAERDADWDADWD